MNVQDEIKALKERIAELEGQIEQEKEFPKYGDVYWIINATGENNWIKWHDTETDNKLLSRGNVFRTKEEAEFAAEKLKVEAILRSYSRPFDEFVNNYFIEFCSYDDSLAINADADFRPQGTFYFDSEEIALQAIDEAGEWHIKRFIFGMGG